MIVLFLFVISIFLLFILMVYERTTPKYKAAVQLNHPGILFPLIGNSYLVCRFTATSAFKELRNLLAQFNSGFSLYYLENLFVPVKSAEWFEKILTSSNTTKGYFYTFLKPYIGTGVLTGFGPKWYERRRLISPSFHFNEINRFFHSFKTHTEAMLESIQKHQNEPINVNSMFSKCSLSLICETTMGVPGKESEIYEETLLAFGDFAQSRVFSPHIHSDIMYRLLGYARQCNRLIKPMLDFTKDMIIKRRSVLESRNWIQSEDDKYSKQRQSSLLDVLLTLQHNNGSIDDEGIEEEVNTFVFSGHDTITTTMAYVLLCIGENPEVQHTLYEEIKTNIKDDELTTTHFASCPYMDLVVKETLRLYPPVPWLVRTLEEDLDFCGVTLPPGTNFAMSLFDLHRDPNAFADPEKFIPERFLPENTANRHRFAYLPYSFGLRNCIGQKYAIMQMKTMIVKIVQHFEMESITKRKDLEFVADMILHTTRPIEIKFISRRRT